MLKPTKKEQKMLVEMAKSLPPTWYQANIRKTGRELKEKFPNQEFELNRTYNYPVKYPTNHKNRILSAYKSGGMEAVNQYVKEVLELVKNENSFKATIAA